MRAIEHQKLSFWKGRIFFLTTNREKLILVLFLVIFIPLFLLIFQPFGVNNYDPSHRISKDLLIGAIGFGLVNGVGLAIYEFLLVPFIFKKNDRLTFTLRMIILILMLSTLTFIFYNVLGNFHDWNLDSFLGFIRDVSLMSIIPLAIILLYLKYAHTQKAFEILRTQPDVKTQEKKLITLRSDNGKEQIAVTLGSLLFIEAQDNYVFVYHLENEKMKKSLLRITMKKLQSELAQYDIVRCHRSFLVNLHSIEKATGNTHQLQLYLPKADFSVPVSRTYIPSLKEQLDIRHA